MKKALLVFFLLHPISSFAMTRARAAAMVAAPIAIPGGYYYAKTAHDQKERLERIEKESRDYTFRPARETNSQGPFIAGVVMGVIPGFNIVCGREIYRRRERLKTMDVSLSFRNEAHGNAIGFVSGASVYLTIPLAVALLKKVPK